MPSTQPPDLRPIISDSTAGREGTAAAMTSDDALSGFTPERNVHVILTPSVLTAPRTGRNDVTPPAMRTRYSIMKPPASTVVSARSRLSGRLERAAPIVTYVQRAHRFVIDAKRKLRLVPTRAALATFAAGTATGISVMSFASTSLTSNDATTKMPLASPPVHHAVPTSRPEAQPLPPVVRAHSASPGLTVATSGMQTGGLDEVRHTRPRSAVRASRGLAAAAPASYRGTLELRSAPPGARVFLNGALVGSTPLVLDNLSVGSRAVRIEADGYERWSTSTQVVANQQTRVSAVLAPAAQ